MAATRVGVFTPGDAVITDDSSRQRKLTDSTGSVLLSAARAQDPQAWNQLVERYSALIYHWCRQAGLDSDDSADVLQCVMLKLAQHLGRFEKDGQPAAFRRWLATITRNCIADVRRTDRDQPHAAGGTDALHRLNAVPAPSVSDTGSGVPANPVEAQLDPLLAEVEDSVGAATWEAFQLTMFQDLTSIEAGEQLGLSPAAVRLAKARVLRRLRDGLVSGSGTN